MKKLLPIILVSVLAAAPVATVFADTTTGSSATMGQAASDAGITTKVKSVLLSTSNVDSTRISVDTVNGVVTLTGTQPSQAYINNAVTAVKGVTGVVSVTNKLTMAQ